MTRAMIALLVGLGLAGCAVSDPVAVIGQGGDVLTGVTNASLASGTFKVANARLSCGGSYDPLDRSRILTFTVRCSDGRSGFGNANRTNSLRSGEGQVHLQDGTSANFVFGPAAAGMVAKEGTGLVPGAAGQSAPIAPAVVAVAPAAPRALPAITDPKDVHSPADLARFMAFQRVQSEALQARQEQERAVQAKQQADAAPHIQALLDAYGRCVRGNAMAYALATTESADVVATAAANSCEAERSAWSAGRVAVGLQPAGEGPGFRGTLANRLITLVVDTRAKAALMPRRPPEKPQVVPGQAI